MAQNNMVIPWYIKVNTTETYLDIVCENNPYSFSNCICFAYLFTEKPSNMEESPGKKHCETGVKHGVKKQFSILKVSNGMMGIFLLSHVLVF